MATQTSIRIREPAEASGSIGVKAAARKYQKYGIAKTTIIQWVKKGEVAVRKPAAFTGDTVLLDEASLRKRILLHNPHRDNQARKPRSRTIPEMRAQAGRNGHASGESNPVSSVAHRAIVAIPAPATASLPDPKGWIAKFYDDKASRRPTKELNPKTKENYDMTFSRLLEHFPFSLPLDRATLRQYILGLKDKRTHKPLSGGTQELHRQTITTLMHWLHREHGINAPDLADLGISGGDENAEPIWPDEIRACLGRCRDSNETDLIYLLAMTGCRVGELCTMHPEFLGDHYITIWGKPTKANESGRRDLPLPDECYARLLNHFRFHKQLIWVDSYFTPKVLTQPITPLIPGRPIDLRRPETFWVPPSPGGVDRVQWVVRRLLDEAGIKRPGLAPHSFRRSYEDEFLNNGGRELYMDRILGHYNKANMADRYLHVTIERLVEEANKYCPRSFLQAPQGTLAPKEITANGGLYTWCQRYDRIGCGGA